VENWRLNSAAVRGYSMAPNYNLWGQLKSRYYPSGANFFKSCVQNIHKSLFPAGKPLRIMIQFRSRFGMGKLFGDQKQRYVTRQQERGEGMAKVI
jgi:hypothetical protein